jgi:hypothetical protein
MSRSRSTRRQFLKTGAVASATLFAGPILDFLGVTDDAFAAYVRPNVKGLTATSQTIVSYKKAIAAMKALPATNPLNWNNFANIHGIGPQPPSGSNPLWDTCQHGQWWFLPWHRMYLWFFERAIRHFSGDKTFALPYWDYTDPTQRAIPSMFRTPTTNNPLYIPQRSTTINAGGQLPASAVDIQTAFGFSNYTGPTGTSASFGSQQLTAPNHGASPHGRLETTPHDSVHVSIAGYMGSFGTAARDPIFWLHHCNIDRLWDLWLTKGGGRVDPNNKTWCDQRFSFPDAEAATPGATVTLQVRGVINALTQLGYSYPLVPAVPAQSCPTGVGLGTITAIDLTKQTLKAQPQPMELGAAPSAVRIVVPKATANRALTARALVLRIEGIDVTAPPGVIYEVYVALPAGTKPDPSLPNYVGNIAPFGAEMHHGEFVAAFRIDAPAKRVITANGGNVDVTFVPRGPLDPQGKELPVRLEGKVTFKQVRLIEE